MSVLAGGVPYGLQLAALAGIWAVAVSPGPDFVVTISHAARSRRAGLAARPVKSWIDRVAGVVRIGLAALLAAEH